VPFQRDIPVLRALRYFILGSMQVYLTVLAALVVVIGFSVKLGKNRARRTRTNRRA